MSKISCGYMVVGGLICSLMLARFAVVASNASDSPATDFGFDVIKYACIAGAIVAAGCFAYGASKFTDAK